MPRRHVKPCYKAVCALLILCLTGGMAVTGEHDLAARRWGQMRPEQLVALLAEAKQSAPREAGELLLNMADDPGVAGRIRFRKWLPMLELASGGLTGSQRLTLAQRLYDAYVGDRAVLGGLERRDWQLLTKSLKKLGLERSPGIASELILYGKSWRKWSLESRMGLAAALTGEGSSNGVARARLLQHLEEEVLPDPRAALALPIIRWKKSLQILSDDLDAASRRQLAEEIVATFKNQPAGGYAPGRHHEYLLQTTAGLDRETAASLADHLSSDSEVICEWDLDSILALANRQLRERDRAGCNAIARAVTQRLERRIGSPTRDLPRLRRLSITLGPMLSEAARSYWLRAFRSRYIEDEKILTNLNRTRIDQLCQAMQPLGESDQTAIVAAWMDHRDQWESLRPGRLAGLAERLDGSSETGRSARRRLVQNIIKHGFTDPDTVAAMTRSDWRAFVMLADEMSPQAKSRLAVQLRKSCFETEIDAGDLRGAVALLLAMGDHQTAAGLLATPRPDERAFWSTASLRDVVGLLNLASKTEARAARRLLERCDGALLAAESAGRLGWRQAARVARQWHELGQSDVAARWALRGLADISPAFRDDPNQQGRYAELSDVLKSVGLGAGVRSCDVAAAFRRVRMAPPNRREAVWAVVGEGVNPETLSPITPPAVDELDLITAANNAEQIAILPEVLDAMLRLSRDAYATRPLLRERRDLCLLRAATKSDETIRQAIEHMDTGRPEAADELLHSIAMETEAPVSAAAGRWILRRLLSRAGTEVAAAARLRGHLAATGGLDPDEAADLGLQCISREIAAMAPPARPAAWAAAIGEMPRIPPLSRDAFAALDDMAVAVAPEDPSDRLTLWTALLLRTCDWATAARIQDRRLELLSQIGSPEDVETAARMLIVLSEAMPAGPRAAAERLHETGKLHGPRLDVRRVARSLYPPNTSVQAACDTVLRQAAVEHIGNQASDGHADTLTLASWLAEGGDTARLVARVRAQVPHRRQRLLGWARDALHTHDDRWAECLYLAALEACDTPDAQEGTLDEIARTSRELSSLGEHPRRMRRLAELAPGPAMRRGLLVRLAEHHYESGAYEACIAAIEDAHTASGARELRVGNMRAMSLIRLGGFDRAAKLTQTMRDWPGEDDDRAQTLLLGGWLALRRQRNDDARKIFGRLVRDFPKSPAARKARQLLESLEAR